MGVCSSCHNHHVGEYTTHCFCKLSTHACTTDQYHIPDNGVGGDK